MFRNVGSPVQTLQPWVHSLRLTIAVQSRSCQTLTVALENVIICGVPDKFGQFWGNGYRLHLVSFSIENFFVVDSHYSRVHIVILLLWRYTKICAWYDDISNKCLFRSLRRAYSGRATSYTKSDTRRVKLCIKKWDL